MRTIASTMHTVDLRTTDSHMDLVTASCGSVGGEGRTAGRVPLPSWGVSAAGKGLLENSGGTWPTIMPRIMSVVIYGVCVALASSFLPLMRARPPRQSAIAHLLGAGVWGGGEDPFQRRTERTTKKQPLCFRCIAHRTCLLPSTNDLLCDAEVTQSHFICVFWVCVVSV